MPSKKTSPKEDPAKKTPDKELPEETASAPQPLADESPKAKKLDPNCRCRQKRNGKFYCFKLQQGRWVQDSGFGFDTQEECEDECCE